MDDVFSFLNSQRLLTVASIDTEPWICNLFYGVDKDINIYFISSEDTKHSKQIKKNPTIAFNVAWYNSENYTDRKAVQGTGVCYMAKNDEEIKKGVELHNKHFPEFASRITVDWVKRTDNASKVWIIKPQSLKFWNDQLFGSEEVKSFIL